MENQRVHRPRPISEQDPRYAAPRTPSPVPVRRSVLCVQKSDLRGVKAPCCPPVSFCHRMVYWELLLGGEELRVPATRSWTPVLCLLPRILAILAKQRKFWSQGRDRGDTETQPMHVTQRHSGTLQPHHSRSETLSQPPGQRVGRGSLGTCRSKKRNTQASRPSLSPWPRSQESGCLVCREEPDWG